MIKTKKLKKAKNVYEKLIENFWDILFIHIFCTINARLNFKEEENNSITGLLAHVFLKHVLNSKVKYIHEKKHTLISK